MKMVINLLLGTGMAAFTEAMALGEGLGLSSKLLFDSLLPTPAVAPFLSAKRARIENGNYEAEFPLRWMQKDMHLATVSAYEAGVAMPLTNIAKEIYRLAMRDGHAAEDFSAIYEYLTNPDAHPRDPATAARAA
jgi:3-hydroxyisobutyrate dehydrogenase-like beta-hydroxyacid dehydrogenase